MGAFVASDLKERNRSTAYALIKAEREISKAEIARRSGISAPTVIKIMDYFSGLGIGLPSAVELNAIFMKQAGYGEEDITAMTNDFMKAKLEVEVEVKE
jgi:hypothetical protein